MKYYGANCYSIYQLYAFVVCRQHDKYGESVHSYWSYCVYPQEKK